MNEGGEETRRRRSSVVAPPAIVSAQPRYLDFRNDCRAHVHGRLNRQTKSGCHDKCHIVWQHSNPHICLYRSSLHHVVAVLGDQGGHLHMHVHAQHSFGCVILCRSDT